MVQKCLESESHKYPQTNANKKALGSKLYLFNCKWHFEKAIFVLIIFSQNGPANNKIKIKDQNFKIGEKSESYSNSLGFISQ